MCRARTLTNIPGKCRIFHRQIPMDNTRAGLDTKHFEPVRLDAGGNHHPTDCIQFPARCGYCSDKVERRAEHWHAHYDAAMANWNESLAQLAEARQQIKDYCDMWEQAHLALTVAAVQSSEDGVLLSLETRIDKLRQYRDMEAKSASAYYEKVVELKQQVAKAKQTIEFLGGAKQKNPTT